MERDTPYRPRVSRETRLLLTAGLAAIAALWLLARFRFQDQPVTPNSIPAVLTQITTSPGYDDLASEIGRTQSRLDRLLVSLDWASAIALRKTVGLRISDTEIVTFISDESMVVDEARIVGWDPASGLAVLQTQEQEPNTVPPVVWARRRLEQPRYLLVGDVSSRGVSLRPTFVGTMHDVMTALWSDAIWALPFYSHLQPGAFLFTPGDAEFVGTVIAHAGDRAIVPGATVLEQAARLRTRPNHRPATLGIDVQALSDAVARVTGASIGMVVTAVTRGGPAEGRLEAGNVIEGVDGRPLTTPDVWEVLTKRLNIDEIVNLRVRRRGEVVDVRLTAASLPAPLRVDSLGLTLRGRSRLGAEVVQVQPGSAGRRAGLMPGDIITLVGEIEAPTPAQVTRSFTSLDEQESVLIAVTRGARHLVTTLER